MIPDWAPNLHPLIIHFPIVLFLVAVAVDLLGYARRSDAVLRSCAVLYVAAGIAALAAFLSGRQAADLVSVAGDAFADLNAHADWGKRTAILTGVLAILRLAWMRSIGNESMEAARKYGGLALTAIGLVGAFFIFETAEHGAKLVFLHGLGTAGPAADPLSRFEQSMPTGGAPSVLEDGSWDWSVPAELEGFVSSLDWIQGAESAVEFGTVRAADGATWMTIRPSSPVWFTFPEAIHSVDAISEMDVSEFEGTVRLTYNTVDSGNYGALEVGPAGSTRQLVSSEGKETVLDTATIPLTGPASIRAVSAGTHFRGYIDGKLVTHGHGTSLKPGGVGLRLDGSGTIRVRRLSAVNSDGHEH